MRLLLASGAAVNQTTNNGCFPLFVAAQHGHLEPVRLLLRAEADPLLRFKEVGTPLGIARQRGHTEVAELLLATLQYILQKNN